MALATRVATLVTVLALTGAPGVLSACVTLCLPEMSGHAQLDGGSGPGEHDRAASPTIASQAALHDHHAMDHGGGSAPAPVPATSARMNGACDDCCAAGIETTVAAVVSARQDTHAVLAPLAAHQTAAVAWLSESRPHLTTPAVPPPSPPRTSAVLRI